MMEAAFVSLVILVGFKFQYNEKEWQSICSLTEIFWVYCGETVLKADTLCMFCSSSIGKQGNK